MIKLEIGSTVGDYQIIGILGAGGMGKVYKVRNVISDRVEAMKVLLPDLVTEPELADRFMREIKVQASLEHPNIAALHTALRIENQLLMLMEFVEGETLEQKLRNGPMHVRDAVDYIAQVLSALGYAHQHGVIHRDIKPANMMLTHGGAIKLMDFGIAKAASDRRLTMTGTTMGSLYYMSPEQIKGAATLDSRSDLYSVGVSLYELVTGKRPFDGDSQFAIMSAHLEKMPVPPLELDPTLPAALNDIILMSVAKDPDQRFQTAEAFRNALANALPQPAATVPVPAPAPAGAAAAAAAPAAAPMLIEPTPPEEPRSHRGLWVAAGAVAAVLAIVAVIQFGPWKKTAASDRRGPAAASGGGAGQSSRATAGRSAASHPAAHSTGYTSHPACARTAGTTAGAQVAPPTRAEPPRRNTAAAPPQRQPPGNTPPQQTRRRSSNKPRPGRWLPHDSRRRRLQRPARIRPNRPNSRRSARIS